VKDRDALRKELADLNAKVAEALTERKAWMDAHMEEFSEFKVGEEIYDLGTGALLGTVSRLYRYWADKDPCFDTSMSVEVEFREIGSNLFDNTSRYAGSKRFGTREQARRAAASEAEYLAWKARGEDWSELFK